jgi:hypothetical protein
MTLEELKNFNPNTHEIYHIKNGLKFSYSLKCTNEFYPDIELTCRFGFYIFTLIGDTIGSYKKCLNLWTMSYINTEAFLKLLEIKPKQKESKMKTTFKQEPTKTLNNSFPKFMKYKESPLVVLFFNEDSGVVVVEDQYCKVNQFSNDWDIWDISLFEPIENCEVTFSNKE